MLKVRVATIKNIGIFLTDDDILTYAITINYDDEESEFIDELGLVALDDYDELTGKRIGSAEGIEIIKRLIRTFGVKYLNEIKNMRANIYCNKEEAIGISKIGEHIQYNEIFFF